jgi:DNA (cytosine-5)-methyltransferase 1
MSMRSIELFAGAGGLAMGLTNAGFKNELVVEWDRDACSTIQYNQAKGVREVIDWNLVPGDVRDFSFRAYEDRIDIVAGGPPCQPFSMGGKHLGFKDERNMFPEMIRAVREVRPKAVLVENVKGLMRGTFKNYVEYIRLQLTHPTLLQRKDESWEDHLRRLERHHTRGKVKDLSYNVVLRLLNAADFGVPQKRERVFFVGFRNDLNVEWSFPEATHSIARLMYDQWVSGEYWERHGVAKSKRPPASDRQRRYLDSIGALFPPEALPWVTVRDALRGLPSPTRKEAGKISNHRFQPGARSYPGHTGSPLDEPAKTLKAGGHGVPGGENMLRMPDGAVRYFTVRESARLQTFPDEYEFQGSWGETMRQLGNAVPVVLAEFIAGRMRDKLVRSVLNGRPQAV